MLMRNIIISIIIVLSLTNLAYPDSYYVKNGGNNALSGVDDTNAWDTLTYALTQVSDGDVIYLKKGSSWSGEYDVENNNITIDAYGSGADPILTGSTSLSTWAVYSGNIYQTTYSGTVYQVIEDGTWGVLWHEPDNNHFRADGSPPNSYTVTATPSGISSEDVLGSQLTCHPDDWSWYTYDITAYDGTYITLDNSIAGPSLSSNKRYYLSNRLSYVDTAQEWYSDGSTVYYYSSDAADPDTHSMEVVIYEYCFDISGYDGFTVQNIDIKNYGRFGIFALSSEDITVDNVDINNIGTHLYDGIGDGQYGERTNTAIYMWDSASSSTDGFTITDSTITNAQGNGIWATYQDNGVITGCTITYVGVNGAEDYAERSSRHSGGQGIYLMWGADTVTIKNNTVSYTLYNGISFQSHDIIVGDTLGNGNTVDHTLWDTHINDGGAIYCANDQTDGSEIKGNTISYVGGRYTVTGPRVGIYLDNISQDVDVAYNTISYASECIRLHGASNSTVDHNVCSESFNGILTNDDGYCPGYPVGYCDDTAKNNVITYNEFYLLGSAGSYAVNMTDLHSGGSYTTGTASTMDYNNYYPNNSDTFEMILSPDGTYGSSSLTEHNLSGWQTKALAETGIAYDANSTTNAQSSVNLSNLSPTSQQECGADPQAVNLSFNTDVNSYCRESTNSAHTVYTDMSNQIDNGENTTSHNEDFSQACGGSTVHYIICNTASDGSGDESDREEITIDVASAGGVTTPPLSIEMNSGGLTLEHGSGITLSIE